MSDPLYDRRLLRLAAAATGAGHLTPCDARGEASNPTCGDRVAVTLRLDAEGRIAALAHETRACVLSQASASILAAELPGVAEPDVRDLRARVADMLRGGETPSAPFQDYEALIGAAQHRNRHNCVLLPIDAVLNALANGKA